MIRIQILQRPPDIAIPKIMQTMSAKLTAIMIELQSRIVGESIPTFFPNGAPNIAASVRAIPATQEGSVIHAEVQAGGPRTTVRTLSSGKVVDYAAVQEYGGRAAYDIFPYSKKVLRFFKDGNLIFAKHVHHPPLEARPFMRSELQNMETQIVAEIKAALDEALS